MINASGNNTGKHKMSWKRGPALVTATRPSGFLSFSLSFSPAHTGVSHSAPVVCTPPESRSHLSRRSSQDKSPRESHLTPFPGPVPGAPVCVPRPRWWQDGCRISLLLTQLHLGRLHAACQAFFCPAALGVRVWLGTPATAHRGQQCGLKV